MTLVLDASVLHDHLLGGRRAPAVASAVRAHDGDVNIPHIAIVETLSVLRRLTHQGLLTAARARVALTDLADAPFTRWPADALLPRMWELRDNLSAYDATYVALAESLDATLLTADARLAHACSSHARCAVSLVAGPVED